MKQEDKELLLKDLCARLSYGVICGDGYGNVLELNGISKPNCITFKCATKSFWTTNLDECKPYLFPMSSMTEEQKEEYYHIVNYISSDDTKTWMEGEFIYVDTTQFLRLINFYHRNHLDYRGLINGGLAIDATGLNIY